MIERRKKMILSDKTIRELIKEGKLIEKILFIDGM